MPPQFFENFTYFARKLTPNHQKSELFRVFAPPVFALPPQFSRGCNAPAQCYFLNSFLKFNFQINILNSISFLKFISFQIHISISFCKSFFSFISQFHFSNSPLKFIPKIHLSVLFLKFLFHFVFSAVIEQIHMFLLYFDRLL